MQCQPHGHGHHYPQGVWHRLNAPPPCDRSHAAHGRVHLCKPEKRMQHHITKVQGALHIHCRCHTPRTTSATLQSKKKKGRRGKTAHHDGHRLAVSTRTSAADHHRATVRSSAAMCMNEEIIRIHEATHTNTSTSCSAGCKQAWLGPTTQVASCTIARSVK
jgi:hypothetical protein